MSLLAPLYFFGAMAIGLPILFHLIRRRPKGEVEFSSLMFLRPTPPRLTRKSRLDNWPLLLIRALALILLAAAFARPFLRSTAQSDSDLPARRTVLLVDTSASMQRAGLWQQALDQAGGVISDLRRGDQLAIVSYDSKPATLLGFAQSDELDLAQLKSTAKKLLSELKPSWNHTDTGRAIGFAADLAVTYEAEDTAGLADEQASVSSQLTGPAHMILISDMQAGSHIESLQVYAWPDQLRLEVKKVMAREKTNAAAQILQQNQSQEAEQKDRVRVRVTNSPDATDSRFSIAWSGAAAGSGVQMPVQVPPGESRLIRMPSPTPGVTSLVLSGDQHSFDNVRYLVTPQPASLTLLHLGPDATQPRESLFYYLRRVPLNNLRRHVTVTSQTTADWVEQPEHAETPLVVVEGTFSADVAGRLRKYVSGGGSLLYVLAGEKQLPESAASLNGLLNDRADDAGQISFQEADVVDYVMLSRIDFGHTVFAPMADPQFNDFTKIRFWSHRKIQGLDDSWRVLSYFDDGDPALIERSLGDGRVWVLAAGWQPAASQLALSTKFIPLVFSLFDSSGGRGSLDRYTLGGPIDLVPSPNATITAPDDTRFQFASAADIEGIDQPGVYRYSDGEDTRDFAVNLNESESRTETLGDTELERFGVTLGKQLSTAQTLAKQRQLRDIELEGRQRLWQWLLVSALVLLAIETWLGGWISRGRAQTAESGLEL